MTTKIKSTRTTEQAQVNEWMGNVEPEMRAIIEVARKIIKAAGPKLHERIKWNAPSYYYKEDIVTFGPTKGRDKVILVFHHPNIVKIKSDLLKGEYKDRRLAYFNSLEEIKDNRKELERIIKESVQLMDK